MMPAMEKKGIEGELIIIAVVISIIAMNQHAYLVLLLFIILIFHLVHFIVCNEVNHSLAFFLHS